MLTIEEKALRKEARREQKWNEQHKYIDGIDHKKCSRCNIYKISNTDYFYPNKSNGIDGLYPYCIDCTIKKNVDWGNNNIERRKDIFKRYNNKPHRRKRNAELGRLTDARGVRTTWRRQNPEKLKEYNEKHTNHIITNEEWESCLDYFDWACAYCGYTYADHLVTHGQQLHREHVNHDGNDYIDNCIPACRTCNTSKHDKDFNEWYNHYNPLHTDDRLNKILKWVTGDWMEWTE